MAATATKSAKDQPSAEARSDKRASALAALIDLGHSEADALAFIEGRLKRASGRKLRVINPDAPKKLRKDARRVTVTAIEKGYYNHTRIKRGDTFKMLVIGDNSLPLPEWLRYSDDPEALAVVNEILEVNSRSRNLPAGVSMSKASIPEVVPQRDLSELRERVARRVAGKHDTPEDDADDDDIEDLNDDDDDGSADGRGGGGGRPGDDVL